ncbi:WecB/TagA/CpsF family glycosyltransferase [Curvibacter sp. CHRR-16]|nr:WecB/TagA/CpsF family glycosyltransferase [Curvibacter sp. CHRR-16]
MTPQQRKLHYIYGLPFDAITLDQAVSTVWKAISNRQPLFISTPNLNFLIASQQDEAFRASVLASDLSLADGMPIVWLARKLKLPITERVAGSDLFAALRTGPVPTGCTALRVYFFGGPDGVAERAAQVINSTSSSMQCVGWASPGFGSVEDMSKPETIAAINACNPDFVVVSLGAAKGQAWIMRNKNQLSAPVISHLGAVVNFVAGNVSRAPRWMQRTGLEWLWRIKEEPQLWKRYWRDGLGLAKLILSKPNKR